MNKLKASGVLINFTCWFSKSKLTMSLRFIIRLLFPIKTHFNTWCLETDPTNQPTNTLLTWFQFWIVDLHSLLFQCIMFILVTVFSKTLLSMFTTSQFLQVHKFKVGDTLEKHGYEIFTYVHNYKIGWNFFLVFARVRIKNIISTYSPLSNCRGVNYWIFHYFPSTSI